MKTAMAWLKASRLPSQSYIFLPILFGQVYASFHSGQPLDLTVLIIAQLFGLFDQLYIVYANDYADRDTDAQNDTWTVFSGGSRVLVDGDLNPKSLKIASILMAALSLACGAALGLLYGRWLAIPIIATGLVLLWMYSYPPVRMSYRGGGELLQMLGVGFILPVFGYYAQLGTLADFPWALLCVLLPTHLACGIATSLPDEPSDRTAGKHTLTVALGQTRAKLLIVALNTLSILTFPFAGWLDPTAPKTWLLMSVAAISNLLILALIQSKPGTLKLAAVVFFAILTTLSVVSAMILALWGVL